MALNSKQLNDIMVLLQRVKLDGNEAVPFVQLMQAIANTRDEAVANEGRAPALPLAAVPGGTLNGLSPEAGRNAIVSSESMKGNKRVQRHVKGILREAQKQGEQK